MEEVRGSGMRKGVVMGEMVLEGVFINNFFVSRFRFLFFVLSIV